MRIETTPLNALLAWCLTAGAIADQKPKEEPPQRGKTLFSELSILPPPGHVGSWVELYNRASVEADVGGMRVVCTGEKSTVFPEGLTIPPKALLLLRFVDAPEHKWTTRKGHLNGLVCGVPALAQQTKSDTTKMPGYLALEDVAEDTEAERHLIDYVRWGRQELADDESYLERATQVGLWHRHRSTPTYIGLKPKYGYPLEPSGQLVLVRYSFVTALDRADLGWNAMSEQYATPGLGNSRFPAPVPVGPLPFSSASCDSDDGFSIGFRPMPCDNPRVLVTRCAYPEPRLPQVRTQVATDPHFENVVFEDLGDGSLGKDAVPLGAYFVRIRWEANSSTSDWSDPVHIVYKEYVGPGE